MSLTAADVAEIMRLVEASSFDELTLEIEGMKLTLKRGAAASNGAGSFGAASAEGGQAPAARSNFGGESARAAQGASSSAPQRSGTPALSATSASFVDASNAAARASAAAKADPNVHEVPSPLLGTFYRSPKPGAPPFVEVGAKVEEDTVVGIIEVMKLMNTVRAGVSGTVTEILVSDGALVEFEQGLVRIRKSS